MKAEYKSAVRSRRMIRDAFFALAEEKDIRTITVTDLIRRADVNRGTFYAHYDDMQDFLTSVMEEHTAGVQAILRELDQADLFQSPLPMFHQLSEAFSADLDFYQLLQRAGMLNDLMERLKKQFVAQISANPIISSEMRNSTAFQSRCYFFIGGVAELYRAWITGELSMTPEELALQASSIIESSSLFKKEAGQ